MQFLMVIQFFSETLKETLMPYELLENHWFISVIFFVLRIFQRKNRRMIAVKFSVNQRINLFLGR